MRFNATTNGLEQSPSSPDESSPWGGIEEALEPQQTLIAVPEDEAGRRYWGELRLVVEFDGAQVYAVGADGALDYMTRLAERAYERGVKGCEVVRARGSNVKTGKAPR